MPKRERIIKLTPKSLIALLQGKDLHLVTEEIHVIIKPPFDGVFMTHKELDQVRHNSEMGVFNTIEKVQKYTQGD